MKFGIEPEKRKIILSYDFSFIGNSTHHGNKYLPRFRRLSIKQKVSRTTLVSVILFAVIFTIYMTVSDEIDIGIKRKSISKKLNLQTIFRHDKGIMKVMKSVSRDAFGSEINPPKNLQVLGNESLQRVNG